MQLNPIPKQLRKICLSDKGLIGLAVINLLGTLFGFYYYLPQFSETSTLLWIFTADSPLATLLIAVSLLMHRYSIENTLINLLAFIGNLKYGLWTVFVLLFYFETFWNGNSTLMYLFLIFSHLGMFLQAFLIYDYSSFSLKSLVLGSTWFIANDGLDYILDIHTYVYAEHSHPFSLIMLTAVSLTLMGITLSYLNRSS